MISIIVPTNRVGGLDLLYESLNAQTEQNFELILVDAIYPWRPGYQGPPHGGNRYPFDGNVQHLDPGTTDLRSNYMRSLNLAVQHARGDTLLYACDYSWFHPRCLETHAEMQKKHRGPVILDYNYVVAPPRKPRLPLYTQRIPAAQSEAYTAELNATTERYLEDLKAGRLNEFMWSVFEKPLTEDAVNALPIEHQHRPCSIREPDDYNWCSFKNESIPTELVLNMNGHDEDYDRSHCWQDQEFSFRLKARGVKWTNGPAMTGMISVVNPRPFLNVKKLLEPLGANGERCKSVKAAVNPGWSLRERRKAAVGA